jgi:hypothetical protein
MLFNILYYDQTKEAQNEPKTDDFSFGPLYLSREQVCQLTCTFFILCQIGIGIIVDILVFIPSTILVGCFRRIRQRSSIHQVSPTRRALSQLQPIQITIGTVQKRVKKTAAISFPWWCLFIAYGLSFVLAALSIFFIIARGIEFGDVKCQKWLTSLATGFFSSILLSQPIKVCSFRIPF